MSRFNAFLVVFAILMVAYLIVEGPPKDKHAEEPATERQYQFFGIVGEDIAGITLRRSDGFSVSIVRQPDGTWQDRVTGAILSDQYLPELTADTVARIPYRELTRYSTRQDLVQYELMENPQLVVSFESSAVTDNITTYSIYIGATTPNNQEHYAVFVNENTGTPQGEWVYAIPEFYIQERLMLLVELFGQLAEQGQGQTPDS